MIELLEFQKKINAIKKDGKNPHFKSTYATLPQILGEVKPILSECGLILMQPIKDQRVGTVISNGKTTEESWLDLPTGLTPQQLGSAITYYRRYTLASLLSLEIEDDDANLASVPAIKETKEYPANDNPWLNETQFKKVLERIKGGDKDAKESCYKAFKVSKAYREQLDKA